MMRRVVASAVALLVIAGLAAALSLLTPMRRPAPAAVELPRATKLTCSLPGTMVVATSAAATLIPVAGGAAQEVAPATAAELTAPANLRADDEVAAGVFTATTPRVYAPCASPTTTGVLLVDDPASAELLLTNADSAEASIDLRLFGPSGELEPVGARGIAIAPGVSRPIALSVLAPEGPIGVVYSASQGRVAALVRNVEGRPARVVNPGAVRSEHFIAGVPAQATSVKLMLTNPTENRVAVTVNALGPSGTYEPASATGVSLAPMTTQALEVAADLNGEVSAVRVTADGEIGASVLATVAGGSPSSLTDSASVTELMAGSVALGTVLLSNPGSVAVDAELSYAAPESTASVTIPAGATVAVEPPAGSTQVRVVADQPISGALAIPGETGAIVVPLSPAAGAPARPGLTELDPALR